MKHRVWAVSREYFEEIKAMGELIRGQQQELNGHVRARADWLGYQVTDGIAIVSIRNVLTRYYDWYTWLEDGTAYEDLFISLDRAAADPEVHSILFLVDSPGGDMNAMVELGDRIAALEKKTVSLISGHGCSAAFGLACRADEVVLTETAMAGSLGVMMAFMDDKERMEKAGIKEIVLYSKNAGMKNPDPASAEGQGEYQRILDDLEDVFLDRIAQGRDVSYEEVLSTFGQGAVFVGKEVVKRGMADRIVSGFDQLLGELNEQSNVGGISFMSAADKKSPVTAEDLLAQYPAAAQTLIDRGKAEGIEAETTRIKGIEKLENRPGAKDILKDVKFDGKTMANDAALLILEKGDEKAEEEKKKIKGDAGKIPALGHGSSSAEGTGSREDKLLAKAGELGGEA